MLSIYMFSWCMHAPLGWDYCNAVVQERWDLKKEVSVLMGD